MAQYFSGIVDDEETLHFMISAITEFAGYIQFPGTPHSEFLEEHWFEFASDRIDPLAQEALTDLHQHNIHNIFDGEQGQRLLQQVLYPQFQENVFITPSTEYDRAAPILHSILLPIRRIVYNIPGDGQRMW